MICRIATLSAWLAWASVTSGADPSLQKLIDDKALAQDRMFLGEYVGVLEGGARWGAQVIPLGEGKYRGVGYCDGLPGDGWTRDKKTHTAEAQEANGEVQFRDDHTRVVLRDDTMTVYSADGTKLGTMKKLQRKSPTLGAKPPQGAIVLFDGTSDRGWKKGKTSEFKGEMVLMSTDCETLETFGDHQLHLEFRTPLVPKERGQGRGNSGVYVQDRYEVQILDSFGLSGEDNECGGVYSIRRPEVNMCFPPESWQTYDIDFRAARYDTQGQKTENAQLTVRHNGVVIHDKLSLPMATKGRQPEGPSPAPLYLQDHQNPVLFRNIWAVKR